jgi:hypothetical protein
MTTYISETDLNSVLEGFVPAYYGTVFYGDGTVTIGTQYPADHALSFQKVNEMLYGIGHLKAVPVGTQRDGNYPYAVRMMQANFMVYQRLLSKHYGEVSGGEVPPWINVYRTRAMETLSDIKGQDIIFLDDVSQGEQGIGVGSWTRKNGTVNLFTNWESGTYQGVDWARVYVVEIDATTTGTAIGKANFKWSRDGGVSWVGTLGTTGTNWNYLENGLCVRWEPVLSGTLVSDVCGLGDRFEVTCVPQNIPVKSGNIRFVTWRRG